MDVPDNKKFEKLPEYKRLRNLWKVTLGGAIIFVVISIFAMQFGNFVTKKIGGVTGDIYGATEILSETSTLIIFLLINFLPI